MGLKKKERRRRKCRWWCDNALAKGPTETAYLRDCHWVTDHEFWKQLKCVFIFLLHHSFFWVTESPKLNHQNWITKHELWSPNKMSYVGPINFGSWVMKTGSYHSKLTTSKHALSHYIFLKFFFFFYVCSAVPLSWITIFILFYTLFLYLFFFSIFMCQIIHIFFISIMDINVK